jgi:hypothetical protein
MKSIKREDIDRRTVDFSAVRSGRRLPPVHPGEILRFFSAVSNHESPAAATGHMVRDALRSAMLLIGDLEGRGFLQAA